MARCFSCGARTSPSDGPTHRYLLSSPGCWAAYGVVLAREYEEPARMALHRLTVDAYAVQHPGDTSRRAVRSVNIHLASLCAVLERGVAPSDATRLIGELTERDDFAWLEPPASLGALDVTHVLAATTTDEHLAAVRAWAEAAWFAWEPWHARVRERLDE
ncbi:MAG: DUF5946 family protein [Planctomycetota bacterium]